MANFLSNAKQSLANTLAETPILTRAYTLIVPLFAPTVIIGSYISPNVARTAALIPLIATSLNVVVGAAAVNHYKNHGNEIHFDDCEKRYCFGRFASYFEKAINRVLATGVENGR